MSDIVQRLLDKHSDLDALTALLRKHKSLPAEVISCMEGAALMDDLSYRICVEASGDNFYTFLERQAAEIERLHDEIAELEATITAHEATIKELRLTVEMLQALKDSDDEMDWRSEFYDRLTDIDRQAATIAAHEATIAELRDVVIAAIAYKESLLQTISSRPQGEQGKPMQGRMIMRQAFIAACEKYEGGDA